MVSRATMGKVALGAADGLVKATLGAVTNALLESGSGLVDRAVDYLMAHRSDAGSAAARLAEEAVDALVAALGQVQAELLNGRRQLTVDDVTAVFDKSVSAQARTV